MSFFEKILQFFTNSENTSNDTLDKSSLLDLPENSENVDEIDKEIMEMDFIDDEEEL